MDAIYDWGLSAIAWLQRGSPGLDGLFEILTFFGDERFLLFLVPLIYWSIDRRSGIELALILFVSLAVNGLLKPLIAGPRPADYSTEVTTLVEASGFGFPSGHAQTAAIVAGYAWYRWPVPAVRALAIVVGVGTPISRVYLGVHFPTDVLGGVVLALVLLLLVQRLGPGVARWFMAVDWRMRLLLAFVPGVVSAVVRPETGGFALGGAMMGMLGGLVLEQRLVRFEAAQMIGPRLVRYAVGIAGMAAFYWGLGAIVGDTDPNLLLVMIRYGSAAVWVALLWPYLFARVLPGRLPAL